jgi:hypothetical protein
MNFILRRTEYSPDGIFGNIEDESGKILFASLEHSFECQAKLPVGTYTCVRGDHRLESMTKDFETFEITNVPGHSGILFHQGNSEKDSSGCVLLGLRRDGPVILGSKLAFTQFMKLQNDCAEFTLIVV